MKIVSLANYNHPMSSHPVRVLVAPVLTALGTAASALTGALHGILAWIMIDVASVAMGIAVCAQSKKTFRVIL